VILYDDRDGVRRADVLSSETEPGAVEQAHRIAVSEPTYNGYELWQSGRKIAAHFFKPRPRPTLMPPDGQQGSHHLRLYPSSLQIG
jgi:hypothetical protein